MGTLCCVLDQLLFVCFVFLFLFVTCFCLDVCWYQGTLVVLFGKVFGFGVICYWANSFGASGCLFCVCWVELFGPGGLVFGFWIRFLVLG